MMNNVSVRHLRAFVEVALCGSFTRASDHLHLTQSTLTATIKQLEQQVGLLLLDRTTRRVLLTSEGERFLPVAERLISDFDTAIADLQSVAGQQRGQVDIAAAPSVLTRLLPPLVHSYRQQFPNIGISLRDDSAGAIEQRILANEVDFGIAGNHSSHGDLNYRTLLRDRYGVVTTPGHSLVRALPNRSEAISWRELDQASLIYLSSDTGIRAQLSLFLEREGLSLSKDTAPLEVSNPTALAALIEEGLGLSVLPALAASTSAFDHLCFTPLEGPVIERDICIITRKGRSLGPAANAMLELVSNAIGSLELPPFVTMLD
ncbi:LysR family transcriptional regulator [Motiliproteus sp. MSK22-1]|uniref:LysR family transcriptional regulator n=1 Tax=Motiliproteus sp. MSK22-1 TaxID=1897630 RepID=UPI000976ACA9|nr:LysR family transcriptional regulator [Motiliproteus sp. MSK22-1]OMH33989.1 LysR family transcriptional regulator [Motiliproteus sp. MSK22-1]